MHATTSDSRAAQSGTVMNSRNVFIVSARLTVVPQIARISAGSSEGTSGTERSGKEDAGRLMCVPSELRSLKGARSFGRTRRGGTGVWLREEWMSPRRFRGVLGTEGLLQDVMNMTAIIVNNGNSRREVKRLRIAC